MDLLPQRQQELLDRIAQDVRAGRTPVIAELIASMGLARESSLTNLLAPLRRKELISIEGGVRGRSRIITLTSRGKMMAGLGLPILGCIPAGPLREAIEEAEEWVDTAHALMPYRAGDFLLRVEGDSMIGDGILPGDKVLLRPNIEVRSGEIAAVQIAGSEGFEDGSMCATLKHVHLNEAAHSITLRAANPRYADRNVEAARVSIAGVYRGLVRSMD